MFLWGWGGIALGRFARGGGWCAWQEVVGQGRHHPPHHSLAWAPPWGTPQCYGVWWPESCTPGHPAPAPWQPCQDAPWLQLCAWWLLWHQHSQVLPVVLRTWSQASLLQRWTEWPGCAPCSLVLQACSSFWHSSPGWGSGCGLALSWWGDQSGQPDHPDHPGRRRPDWSSAVDSCTALQGSHTQHSAQTCSCMGRAEWLTVEGGVLAHTATPCVCAAHQWIGWGTAWLGSCS